MKALALTCWLVLHWSGQMQVPPKNPPAEQQAPQPQAAPTPPASPAQPKIDPGKEADIRKLLEISGAKRLMQQSMDGNGEKHQAADDKFIACGRIPRKVD
jgi:hypothetical protein